MKKKRVTYGVHGMMEYQAVVKLGKNVMKVTFSDGSMNSMGVNPATYTTDSLPVQHAIETCADYKRGRIKIVNTIELDEELPVERNVRRHTEEQPEGHEEEQSNLPVQKEPADSDETREAAETSGAEQEMKRMEFGCNDDAKDYMETTFGYIRSKLRTREDIVAAGLRQGVEIVFV